jgi:peptidyl-dipeptidase Dcp
MPREIIMRHRLPHFQHLFSSSSYAAAYYVYLWAEVLDADAFDAFLEAGSCFDPATAARARSCIYAAGASVEPGAAFRAFRGRDPSVVPMLKKKLGLGPKEAAVAGA